MSIVTYLLRDSFGREQKRSYENRTPGAPAGGEVVALANALAAITRLGVETATVSYQEDISAAATVAANEASRQNDARLEVKRSGGGTYTFNLPHPKPALVNADGTLDIANAAFTTWVELFDDGLGIGGVAGDWFISDGDEVAEGVGGDNIIRGFLYKD